MVAHLAAYDGCGLGSLAAGQFLGLDTLTDADDIVTLHTAQFGNLTSGQTHPSQGSEGFVALEAGFGGHAFHSLSTMAKWPWPHVGHSCRSRSAGLGHTFVVQGIDTEGADCGQAPVDRARASRNTCSP